MSKDIDTAAGGTISSPTSPPRVDQRTRKQLDALPPDVRARAEAAISRAREEVAGEDRDAGGAPIAPGDYRVWGRHGDRLDFLGFLGALRRERERLGLSLDDMAERTGMDRMAISRLENGKNANPTVSTLVRYANALGRSLAWGLAGPTADAPGPRHRTGTTATTGM